MKNLYLILIGIITIACVCALVYYMHLDTFSFAWALNFLLMIGTFAFTETMGSKFSSAYYDDKQWERRGKVYESIGIHTFRKFLVWTGWEKLNKKANPVGKKDTVLMHLYQQTKKSELGHLIIFIIVIGFSVYVASRFGVLKSVWLLVLNIVFNLYPIFLQRYNRPRLKRILKLDR